MHEASYKEVSNKLLNELKEKEIYRHLSTASLNNAALAGISNFFHNSNIEATITSVYLNSIVNESKEFKLSVDEKLNGRIIPTMFASQASICDFISMQSGLTTLKFASKMKELMKEIPSYRIYLLSAFIPRVFIYGNTEKHSKKYFDFIKIASEDPEFDSDFIKELIAYYIFYDQIFIGKLYRAMEAQFPFIQEIDMNKLIEVFSSLFTACLPFMEHYRQMALSLYYEKEGKDGTNSIIFRTLLPSLLRGWQRCPAFAFSQGINKLCLANVNHKTGHGVYKFDPTIIESLPLVRVSALDYDLKPLLSLNNWPQPVVSIIGSVPIFFTIKDNAIASFVISSQPIKVDPIMEASPIVIKQALTGIDGIMPQYMTDIRQIPEIAALNIPTSDAIFKKSSLQFNKLLRQAAEMGVDPVELVPGVKDFGATDEASVETVFLLAMLVNIARHVVSKISRMINEEDGVQPALNAVAAAKEMADASSLFNDGLMMAAYEKELPLGSDKRGIFYAIAEKLKLLKERSLVQFVDARLKDVIAVKGKKPKVTSKDIDGMKAAILGGKHQEFISIMKRVELPVGGLEQVITDQELLIERVQRVLAGLTLDHYSFDVNRSVDFDDCAMVRESEVTAILRNSSYMMENAKPLLSSILSNIDLSHKNIENIGSAPSLLFFYSRALALDELYDRINFVIISNQDNAKFLLQRIVDRPNAYAIILGETQETAVILNKAVEAGLPFKELSVRMNEFVKFLTAE